MIITKAELRKLYLEKRRSLSLAEHAEMSEAIAAAFFNEIDLSRLDAIHSFISMKHTGEVETSTLFSRIWQDHQGVRTFAPRVNDATDDLESVSFMPGTVLTESRWQIAEPSEGAPSDPRELDLVVVPLLCFDLLGFRVGYGKGYYDRFLGKCRPECLKVGLSFYPPVEKIEDSYSGDVRLDVCVMPDSVYHFST